MSLDCGRKLEYLKKPHAGKEDPSQNHDFNQEPILSVRQANPRTTLPPVSVI